MVDLKHIPTAKRCAYTEDGKNNRKYRAWYFQTAFSQPCFQIFHGATAYFAICINFTITHCQGRLSKLGRHSQKAKDHHPEGCSRSTCGNRNSDTGNIAQSHRCRKCGSQGLKMGNLSWVGGFRVFPSQCTQSQSQRSKVDEFKVNRQEDRSACQPD